MPTAWWISCFTTRSPCGEPDRDPSCGIEGPTRSVGTVRRGQERVVLERAARVDRSQAWQEPRTSRAALAEPAGHRRHPQIDPQGADGGEFRDLSGGPVASPPLPPLRSERLPASGQARNSFRIVRRRPPMSAASRRFSPARPMPVKRADALALSELMQTATSERSLACGAIDHRLRQEPRRAPFCVLIPALSTRSVDAAANRR